MKFKQFFHLFFLFISIQLIGQTDCTSPHSINMLPFSSGNLSVNNSGDNGFCEGEDYFFKYIPATDECITITSSFLVPLTGGSACMQIYKACPDDPTSELIAFADWDIPFTFGGDINLSLIHI